MAQPVGMMTVGSFVPGRFVARWWGIDARGRTESEALRRLVGKVAARLDRDARAEHREVIRHATLRSRLATAAAAIRKGAN